MKNGKNNILTKKQLNGCFFNCRFSIVRRKTTRP
nr:MAG TPA: hypothetical protein [Caudoviricetes sp.]DAS56273.1 MAG TPA: hypothetical protein [Caudoviricetes sp.]